MLTAEGCRERRKRLWEGLSVPGVDYLWLMDPIHLRYLASFSVDPFSLGADYGGLLLLRRDGHATLFHDDRLPAASVEAAQVDEQKTLVWYDGQSPGRGPRRRILTQAAASAGVPLDRIHDSLADPLGEAIGTRLAAMRRQKYPDEVELLRRCMRAGEAGQAWAREHVRPGMTELDVYCGVDGACMQAAGRPVIVYGDFAVSTGPERRGGPPTNRILAAGDTLILDFSVVIDGYRSDFTNTLAVGRSPTADQRRIFDLCLQAMRAGERQLRAGSACKGVYDAVRDAFGSMADHFPHHAGHGLGLAHPEAPFFVRHADETLLAGDVVTLEPGLYVTGVGGVRLEHNYLITATGFEQLSQHALTLS